jgi:hypothetical protein
VARGLSYGKRRHETNPNEDNSGDGEKTSVGNTSANGKEGEVVGHARQKTRDAPVFKRGKRKANFSPRFVHHPILSIPSRHYAPLRTHH